jgi:acyl-coenzyme A thioesterase 9
MRLAFELAYSTGYIFTRSRISFVAVDDIIFRQPVSIGSLLSLTSQIVYSKGSPSRSFQVSVKADVIDPIHDTQATTNTFQFTFAVPPNTPLPKIMPRSYDETMRYIGGQRRRDKWMKNTMLKRLSQP